MSKIRYKGNSKGEYPSYIWLERKTIKRGKHTRFLCGEVLAWTWEPSFDMKRFIRFKLDEIPRRRKK